MSKWRPTEYQSKAICRIMSRLSWWRVGVVRSGSVGWVWRGSVGVVWKESVGVFRRRSMSVVWRGPVGVDFEPGKTKI